MSSHDERDGKSGSVPKLDGPAVRKDLREGKLCGEALAERGIDEPITEEERREAEALRDALEGRGDHDLANLARAVRLAVNPKDIEPVEHETLLRRVLHRPMRAQPKVVHVAFGAAAALALAAGLALVLSRTPFEAPWGEGGSGTAAAASLVRSRSTQPLFEEKFPAHGGNSARMDRISDARSKDYRANLYTRLGVR